MKEILVSERTLPEAYHDALLFLHELGKPTPCSDYNTNQIELSMTMVVEEPLAEPMISKLFIGGFKELEQYRQEILDGILDFEIEQGNWKYTYHDRMTNWCIGINQIDFVIRELKRNPDSRRAVICIRTPDDVDSPDCACLQHIHYFIRENKLHSKVLFRSNDACKAAFMNSFGLIMLQKKIADTLNVEMGSYTHRANSFHCYEKDIPLLTGYVNRIVSEDIANITYNYVGEWDELMEEVKVDIAKMVQQQKEKYNQ